MMDNISFRIANSNDISLITSLADKIWHEHYPTIISHKQIDYMLASRYSAKAIKEGMEKGEVYHLAYEGENLLGYAAVERLADSYYLHKFYLLTAQHRKGIGSAFFRYILEQTTDSVPIRLQVNRKNIKAVNFYFKQGFCIEYAKDFDIGEGFLMEDFVMIRNL